MGLPWRWLLRPLAVHTVASEVKRSHVLLSVLLSAPFQITNDLNQQLVEELEAARSVSKHTNLEFEPRRRRKASSQVPPTEETPPTTPPRTSTLARTLAHTPPHRPTHTSSFNTNNPKSTSNLDPDHDPRLMSSQCQQDVYFCPYSETHTQPHTYTLTHTHICTCAAHYDVARASI